MPPGSFDAAAEDETVPLGDPRDSGQLRVVILSDGGVTVRPLPERGTVVIGRGKSSDLPVDDASISRRHAVLHLNGDAMRIEDAGSQNGTRVAGKRLARGERVEVIAGEALELGAALLVLQRGRQLSSPRRGPPRALSMADLQRLIERLAGSTINVLLRGETGVGKELLATRLHELSPRKDKPFVQLNCAALNDNLLEAELFGHDKGVFTGADRAREGHLEAAHGGTLFLDEVGEMSAALQAKLLRVIEQRAVLRVGSTTPRPVDLRILSATNTNLEEAMERGRFRKDLFFRLNGFEIRIPPLRARVPEIAGLAREFIASRCRLDARPLLRLSADALRALEGHDWPGNVRELRNAIERAVIECPGPTILPEHLPPLGSERAPAVGGTTLRHRVEAAERARIVEALEASAGNVTNAAEALGVSRRTLNYRIKAYGLGRRKK